MTLKYRETGSAELAQRLRALPEFVRQAIEDKLDGQAAQLSREIKDKLSGGLLQSKSGRLRASIYARVYRSANKISLSVGSRGDVPYAELQEEGGIVSHPGVSSDKLVVFTDRVGAKKFTHGVMAHTIVISGKSFLKSTIEEDRSGIIEAIRGGVEEAVREHGS